MVGKWAEVPCLIEGVVSPQVLLRMKENEIEYLHKEIGCLRNELQFLHTVTVAALPALFWLRPRMNRQLS